MPDLKHELSLLFTADNLMLALLMVGTVLFSILAARAEQRLWHKARQIPCRLRKQRFITAGKSRLR